MPPPVRFEVAITRARLATPDECEPALAEAERLAEVCGSDRMRLEVMLFRAQRRDLAVDEARMLNLASRVGVPHVEGRALIAAARRQGHELERARALCELALELCDARSVTGARALAARADVRIQLGEASAAIQDAHQAVDTLLALGLDVDAHKTRQAVLVVSAWEQGRPATVFRLLEELLDGFERLNRPWDAALSALLLAEAHCDLGDASGAQRLLGRFDELRARSRKGDTLIAELVRGRIAALDGDPDRAAELFQEARDRGITMKLNDFVYQPAIWLARTRLEVPSTTQDGLAEVSQLLLQALEFDAAASARYEGELCALLAVCWLERNGLEEARTWAARAAEWQRSHPESLTAPEIATISLLVDATEADQLERSEDPKGRRRAEGLWRKVREGLEKRVRRTLQTMTEGFDDPVRAAGFVRHHPATRWIRRFPLLHAERLSAEPVRT